MSTRHRMTIGGTALILGLSMAAATVAQSAVQGNDDHAAHHPEGDRTAQATPQPAPVAPAPTAPIAPGMGRPGGMMMPGGTGPTMPMMQGRMGGPMGDGMPGMGGMRQGAMMPFYRIEGWLAFLRAELRITDAQAPQWNAYADAMRARAQGLRDIMARTMQSADQPATAPQIMERRIALLSAQVEAMRAVSGALGALYAALNDEQKRTADELIGGHVRGMGMPCDGSIIVVLGKTRVAWWRTSTGVTSIGVALVGLVYVLREHYGHALGALPYLILLACPLMHLLLHRGHGHGR